MNVAVENDKTNDKKWKAKQRERERGREIKMGRKNTENEIKMYRYKEVVRS